MTIGTIVYELRTTQHFSDRHTDVCLTNVITQRMNNLQSIVKENMIGDQRQPSASRYKLRIPHFSQKNYILIILRKNISKK